MRWKGKPLFFACFALILTLVLGVSTGSVDAKSKDSFTGKYIQPPEVVQLVCGTVVINQKAKKMKVHTYIALNNSVTTHIIESGKHLVVVDAQMSEECALEARAYADGLGKPIERLIISHAHRDHYSGLPLAFADVPFYALEGSLPNIEAATGLDGNVLSPGIKSINGVRYEFIQVLDAESAEQLVIKLPHHGVIIVQDLAYNDLHLFLGSTTFDGWVEALRSLQMSQHQNTVLVGHGYPTDTSVYEQNIIYLKTAQALVEPGIACADFQAEMVDRFLHLDGEGVFFYLGFVPWCTTP